MTFLQYNTLCSIFQSRQLLRSLILITRITLKHNSNLVPSIDQDRTKKTRKITKNFVAPKYLRIQQSTTKNSPIDDSPPSLNSQDIDNTTQKLKIMIQNQEP